MNNTLCFIDFGFEHVSLLIATLKYEKLVDIPLVLSRSITLPSQRHLDASANTEAFETMLLLIDEAEKKLHIDIYSVILIIKSSAINSFFAQSEAKFLKKKNISHLDEEKLSMQVFKAFYKSNSNNCCVLDFICNNFTIDDENDVKNPHKILCKSLRLNATIIWMKQTAFSFLKLSMERFKIHTTHYLSSCVCVSSLMSDHLNCNDNFLFIDFGSGMVEYCVYRKGCLINLGHIELGGIDITHDIAEEMAISLNNADDAKKNINNDSIQNTNSAVTKYVINKIEEIIDVRLKEIVESIFDKLNKNGELNISSFKKIYIYGGVCGYKNIKNIIMECFHTNVEFLDASFLMNQDFFYKKIKQEYIKNENIQLFGAVRLYVNYVNTYANAKRGFLFKISSKISCFLKDLLY